MGEEEKEQDQTGGYGVGKTKAIGMGREWIRRLRVLYDWNYYRPAMSNNVRLLGRVWLCNNKEGGGGKQQAKTSVT